MRNIQKLIVFTLFTFIFSCSNDDTFKNVNSAEKKEDATVQKPNTNQKNSQNNGLQYSRSTLIIQYKNGTSDSIKNAIRANYGITQNTYEICRCDNEDIEKWAFSGGINIEPKKLLIEGEPIGGESFGILDVDYEFIFGFEMNDSTGGASDIGYESYIKDGNGGITIAVLDTGLATGLTVFNDGTEPTQFLYDATATALGEEKSGWDFVNKEPNTYDDDPNKHGSIISFQINSALTSQNVAHQILPIKIANKYGKISYFNALCGTLRAFEIADVINMSFGWYGDPFGDFANTIFENLIETHSNVIVVASAGNSNNDNDMKPHYPSSFPQKNIISVASSNETLDKVSSFSNYGSISVDFFAQGEGIPFYGSFVEGTSFAAPQVAIEVARLFYEYGILSPETLRMQLSMSGIPVSESFKHQVYPDTGEEIYKNTFYNKLIIPFD